MDFFLKTTMRDFLVLIDRYSQILLPVEKIDGILKLGVIPLLTNTQGSFLLPGSCTWGAVSMRFGFTSEPRHRLDAVHFRAQFNLCLVMICRL